MKKVLALVAAILSTSVFAAEPTLKAGVFTCEDSWYKPTVLIVRQHPTKPEKMTINWEGTPRILHRVTSASGAVRYEGAVSKLVYIQTPSHSLVLNSQSMRAILSDCK